MPRNGPATIAKSKVDDSAVHFQKTKMCKFHLLGRCTRGTQCAWAHSNEEMKALPNFYKTKLCHTFQAKGVCKNAECRYAHGYSELRTVEGKPAHPTEREQEQATPAAVPTLLHAFPAIPWGGGDGQVACMPVIHFAPAVTMPNGGVPVPRLMLLEKGLDAERGNEKSSQSFDSQSTDDDFGFGGTATPGTSEDGHYGVSNSPGSATWRATSNKADGFDSEELVIRVRNTFLEFGSAEEDEEEDYRLASPAFSSGHGGRRRRARSMDARVNAAA